MQTIEMLIKFHTEDLVTHVHVINFVFVRMLINTIHSQDL